MVRPVRVLIADDTGIAREGLRRILSTHVDVVGASATIDETIRMVHELNPDLVLLDLKWYGNERAGIEAICQIKASRPDVKVFALTAYDHLLDDARAAGADLGLTKDFTREQLVACIKASCADPKELGSVYIDRLSRINIGHADAGTYEALLYEILGFLLSPSLTSRDLHSRTWLGTRVRDVVFFNGSQHPFWQSVRARHNSEYVVFELKNTARIEPEYVDQLGHYLGRALGRFGILIGRQQPTPSVWLRQMAIYNSDDKVILVMWDEHIRTMLSLKAAGVDPTDTIQCLYADFGQQVQ